MHAAEHDVFGVGLGGQLGKLERVTGEVGVLVDVGALVVVAQQHGTLAEAGAGGADAFLRLFVGEDIETIEADGGDLHDAGHG